MLLTHGGLLAVLPQWLIPAWFISAGAALGAVVLLVIFGVVALVSRRAASQIPSIIGEGILQPLCYVVIFLAGFAVLTSFQAPIERVVSSIRRISAVGSSTTTIEIPALTENFPIEIEFYPEEVQSYIIRSSQDLVLDSRAEERTPGILRINAEEPLEWKKTPGGAIPFPGEPIVQKLFATNPSSSPAKVEIDMVTNVEYPQVYAILGTAASLVTLFAVYFAIRLAFPKVSAIAATTTRQAAAQPVFYLAIGMVAFGLVASIYLPYNTFGDDVKMLIITGLPWIRVWVIIVAVWAASISIAEEIEGRTALTLLSKPIGRRQFILGKFLGIVWPVAFMFILLGLVFLVVVSYKVVYDARELAREAPNWQTCYAEMMLVVPGLALGFMEALLLTAVSVAISTRLPMLANLIILATLYLLGHLVPLLVQSPVAQFEVVHFVGMLFATILPDLDHFTIDAAMFSDQAIPMVYLGWALMYCILYSSIAMLLALAMFEDRDLA